MVAVAAAAAAGGGREREKVVASSAGVGSTTTGWGSDVCHVVVDISPSLLGLECAFYILADSLQGGRIGGGMWMGPESLLCLLPPSRTQSRTIFFLLL